MLKEAIAEAGYEMPMCILYTKFQDMEEIGKRKTDSPIFFKCYKVAKNTGKPPRKLKIKIRIADIF